MPNNTFDLDHTCARDHVSVESGRVHNTKFTAFMLLHYAYASQPQGSDQNS